MSEIQSSLAINYRTGVNAADVLAPPTLSNASAVAGGSASAGTYNVAAIGVNAFGRTTRPALKSATTASSNLTVRLPIAQLAGAAAYDIYCSTDADPKWVGRITEAQRASGILITAVGVTGAGGIAGAVDIQIPGTGQQALTTAAENTAYTVPVSPINSVGNRYVDFDITATLTGDAASPSVTLIPFVFSANSANYVAASAPVALSFGGASGQLSSLTQKLRVETRGNAQVILVVAKMAGTGLSLNIDYVLT